MISRIVGGCLVLGALLGSATALAFQPNASMQSVQQEVEKRLGASESLATIATAARAARVSAGVLATALIAEGTSPAKVATALVAAGFPALEVIAAATQAGGVLAEIQSAAIAGGADPTAILSATAAGPSGPAAGSLGFAPSRFGITRAATVGGGGRGSVSRS